MAEAVLSAALSVLLDRSVPTHLGSFIRGRDVEKDLNKLKKTVRKIDQVMNDAENKQFKSPSVKIWLDELRDAAYDAEDVIEEFSMEALRMKLKLEADQSQTIISTQPSTTSFFASMRYFSSEIESKITAFTTSTFSSELESKIKETTERFNDLEEESSKLGLEEIKVVASWSSSSSHAAFRETSVFRETSSVVDESFIYGRKDDERKIIELLHKEESSSTSRQNNKFSVIPIVGMGGVGKTTLAQLVYNSNWVQQNHYNAKAWVCVSDKFDIKRITKAILESVTSSPCHVNDDLNSLQVKVKESLSGKKFLIVLDDVWNKNYGDWDCLQKPFGVGAAGSAIIVTTRDRQVARNMGTVNHYDLELLSEDDCWCLFVHHAFGILSVDARPALEIIGKKIARKCKGLPLAAKSLGGILRSKEEFEWENVLNSKIWDLPEEESDILPVLKLSFFYLPSHLKRCFTYCSIFPKDYEFQEEKLVQLWMAEGFLQQPNEKMKLEDFGRKCFRELLSKSFFQPSSVKWFYRSEPLYLMHDLMSDLALWAAGKTCIRLEDSWDMRSPCMKARHLSCIMRNVDNEVKKFEELYGVEFLRTFLQLKIWCQIESLTSDLLPKMKFLRVLSFPESFITELPSSIGDLKHLRYIDLSKTFIRSIPESVCTLYNLQTLLLNNCSDLMKLPEKLQNLINLRHFDLSTASVLYLMEAMPPKIGRLTSLRNLSDFVVGKDSGCGIEELANLKHLEGTLRISKLENVIDAEQAKAANLSDKKGLSVLEMKWCSQFDNKRNERVENEVFDKLRPPHEKLKELTIICYGGVSFPTWLGDATFSSMVLLQLEGCEKCTHLPPLGQLPLLKELFIERMNGVVTVGPEFYGKGRSNPFPSLEKLSFVDMKEWRDWLPCVVEMRYNLFALLRELRLDECSNLLGSLPDHLPSLKRLEIKKCYALQSVSAISGHNCNSRASILEVLDIEECTSLTSLFSSSSSSRGELPATLNFFEIGYCPRLESLGERFQSKNQSLDKININNCKSLIYLPENLHSLTRLTDFSIVNCRSLVRFPNGGLPTAKLRNLEIDGCEKLEALPNRMHDLTSLQSLIITKCPNIVYLFPQEEEEEEGGFPTSITKLKIEGPNICKPLFQWGLNRLSSLTKLFVKDGCPDMVSFPAEAETEGEKISIVLPSSLIVLTICDFQNLESLSSKGFQNLTSLETLGIWICPKLKYFPESGLPPSLLELDIYDCNLLNQRCERDKGQEWSKISHVPHISIDELF